MFARRRSASAVARGRTATAAEATPLHFVEVFVAEIGRIGLTLAPALFENVLADFQLLPTYDDVFVAIPRGGGATATTRAAAPCRA